MLLFTTDDGVVALGVIALTLSSVSIEKGLILANATLWWSGAFLMYVWFTLDPLDVIARFNLLNARGP